MQANIFVQDVIGEDTTLQTVRAQYQAYDSDKVDNILVTIDSVGGLTDEGYAIYDYLKELGKPITTKILGRCYSIATVIALAGDKRKMTPNSKIMIHNPWVELRTGADAKLLKNLSEDLQEEEDKLSKFYANYLNKPLAEIESLMDVETYLNPSQAKEIGFITEEPQELKAVAQLNENKYKMSKQEVTLEEKDKTILSEIQNSLRNLLGSVKAEESMEKKEAMQEDVEVEVDAEEHDKIKMMEEAINKLQSEIQMMKEEKAAMEKEKVEASDYAQAKEEEVKKYKSQFEAINAKLEKLSVLGLSDDAPTKESTVEKVNAKDQKEADQLKAYQEMKAKKEQGFRPLINR